uniref:Uncharacterized protein n=1 Tax=Araucaria cunninghamii TaxID=56994 RepID=A0A0D6R141_ARACU
MKLVHAIQWPSFQWYNTIRTMICRFTFYMPHHQQRQILLQAQASSLPSILGETDPRKPKLLRANGLTGIDCLPIENDGSHSVGGQMHVSSMARVPSQDQNDLLYKIKMAHLIQQQQPPMSSQQNLQQHQQQQLQQQQQETHQQSGRKRKHPSSSGAANSTGTGNTPGPSGNSLPSTPSTHTPGDMMSMAGTLQQSISASKNLMIHGSDGTGGLASPPNQLVDIEHFEDCALDENIESYLAHDNGEKMEGLSDTMKSGSEGHRMDSSKGLSFREVGCLRSVNSKLLCCHFSSDGKLLASAGHDKKAVLWNVDSSRCKGTINEHTDIITDVRFSPNSMRLATSSFDRTVRVWDVDNHNYSLRSFTGHSTPIKSVDFHPSNSDILCSCDEGSEIRYWSISQGACKGVFKGGTTQLRFQPQVGKYLATAAENAVAVFDVETSNCVYSLQKHDKPVQSLCWNATGNLVASVSEDCVKISSIADGGKCIQEMKCTGNVFQTCVFNPNYQAILVIGCNETLELWNMHRHTNMTIGAHESLITSLTESAATGMIASASHDSCVKLWR